MSKFTGDRAELLACQKVDVAIATLMKFSGLPSEYLTKETIDVFIKQAREFGLSITNNLDRMTKMLGFMNYQSRLVKMLKLESSDDFSSHISSYY
jgi:hypothetical protein